MSRSSRLACFFVSSLLALSFGVGSSLPAQAEDTTDPQPTRPAVSSASPQLAAPPVDHRVRTRPVGAASEHRSLDANRAVQSSRVSATADDPETEPSVYGHAWETYSGDGVEGITVRIWPSDLFGGDPVATTVTDAYGYYSLGVLPAGDYRLEFTGDGYIDQWWKNNNSGSWGATVITVTANGLGVEADAELDHLDTISGTLTSSKGKPLAGRWITLFIWMDAGYWGELESFTTDSAGRFSFPELRPGSYAVDGEMPKGARLKAEAHYVSLLSFSGSKNAGLLSPWVLGSPSIGLEQKADVGPGKWKKASFSYQWLRDGVTIPKATKKTYTPGSADLHAQLQVRVTSHVGNYWVTATSPTSWPLLRSSVPQIRGTVAVGSEVTADAGAWESASVPSYQWYADGKAIAGATAESLTLTTAQKGKRLTVKVSGQYLDFPVISRTSSATAKVATAGTPTVSGSAVVGSTLKAAPGAWTKRTKLSYRWLRDGVVIGKATKPSYKLTAADAGTHISVRVTGKLRGYGTVSMTSAPLAIPA